MNTYRDAGVDIEAGERLVDRIKGYVRQTKTPGALGGIGAFGGFFRPDFGGMKDPVLVSSVDGVGTKLKVAVATGMHHTVGQCLVNHCVNDILACGATPLFFLDYFATGKLEVDTAAEVIRGFSIACRENGCALIGGETAEMPSMYAEGEYDLAGTIVGMVDRERILDGSRVTAGDVALALPSTGLHTNGYSLARKVLLEGDGPGLEHRLSDGRPLGEALLAVHRSYLSPVRRLLEAGVGISALSHITGGGIHGNTRRVLPEGHRLDLDHASWEVPELFRLIQDCGGIAEEEMFRAFNMGLGMLLLLPPAEVEKAVSLLEQAGERPMRVGCVIQD